MSNVGVLSKLINIGSVQALAPAVALCVAIARVVHSVNREKATAAGQVEVGPHGLTSMLVIGWISQHVAR